MIKRILDVWRIVFGNWRYSLLAVAISFSFYVLVALISNINNILSFFRYYGIIEGLQFTSKLVMGFHMTVLPSTVLTMIFLDALTGILFSLLIYRYKVLRNVEFENNGFVGSLGVFFGIIAPGCAACGIGLAALLGISSSIAALPFQGREISLFAIIILLYSVIKVSNNFLTCKGFYTDLGRKNKGKKNGRRKK